MEDADPRAVDASGRAARSARRFVAPGCAGRRHRDRRRRSLGARSRRPEIAVQEHAVRRGAFLGPRGAHHCRRPHRLRARLTREGLLMGPEAFYPLALLIGYLLGSIPFGLVLTRLA